MSVSFGDQLRRLRVDKGFSQQQLADMIHVDRSTITNWEIGRRLPDAAMITLLSDSLGVDVVELLRATEKTDEKPKVIVVDDERIILKGEARLLAEAMPHAQIHTFTVPVEALAFAKQNKCQIAFLDIEMGLVSGLDVCRDLLGIEPHMNVIFLTAYRQYALDAWGTGACGFLLKPLDIEAVEKQLTNLRWPVGGLQ